MTAVHELLLDKFLEKNEVPHLLLFSGKDVSLMRSQAISFAKRWLQNNSSAPLNFTGDDRHPDIHIAVCEGKLGLHSIASIRLLIEKMAYEPFQAKGKVFIVEACDRMLPTSANALLKSFEEPYPGTVIILITTKEELLLPTIRSRCMRISFVGASSGNMKLKNDEEMPGDLYQDLAEKLSSLDSFEVLSDHATYFASLLEEKKRELENAVSSFYTASLKELSSQQRQKLEQEIEGEVSTRFAEELDRFLQAIYELYRDAIARSCGVGAAVLFSQEANIRCPQSLEKVGEALAFTKLAIERSTPIQNALETLFYKLKSA